MENNPPSIVAPDEGRSKKNRIMGKLFGGRDRKVSGEEKDRDLAAFLSNSSDTLSVAHAAPPVLTKLDTSSVTRYPNALQVEPHAIPLSHTNSLSMRQRSHSPRGRNKKGLVVRFVDTFPEIIGQGGDECEIPTVEIAKYKRSRPPPITAHTAPPRPADMLDKSPRAYQAQPADDSSFMPPPMRRAQTGFGGIPSPRAPEIPASRNAPAQYLGTPVTPNDDKRKSYIEEHYSQMREAEGRAFANAVRSASQDESHAYNSPRPSFDVPPSQPTTQPPDYGEPPAYNEPPAPEIPIRQRPLPSPQPQHSNHRLPPTPVLPPPTSPLPDPESPDSKLRRTQGTEYFEQSPSSVYSNVSGQSQLQVRPSQRNRYPDIDNTVLASPLRTTLSHQESVSRGGDESLSLFVARTRHLFELFRLQSETIRPLATCSLEDLVKAAVWWFLNGRLALETAVRDRPTSPTAQQRNEMAKQQAYANLAKGYWLCEDVIPEVASNKRTPPGPEVEETRKVLVSNLHKLTGSMRRNGFLPPEEAMLPQTIDKTIWLEYPQLSQDIIALLWGSSSSALMQTQRPLTSMDVQEALPLGDSPFLFCFSRVTADVYLMEQGMEAQRLYLPCMLSILRPQKQAEMMFVLASQDHTVQLRISANKAHGPTWDDVQWHNKSATLDIRLPRGFYLVVQCSPADYRMLWNMYDFSSKVQSSLYPLKDEQLVFRSTLRSFQYFDNDPQARQFPKEPVPNCEVALFERIHQEGAATGLRTFHLGHRLAVVTGPRTKAVSGINQLFHPHAPLLYGFLRSDQNDPALSIKFENSRTKGNMVFSFNDDQERLRLHSLLIGTALRKDEQVWAEINLSGLWFSERFGETADKGLSTMTRLPWQRLRVINDENGEDTVDCVLAEKLRVVFEFKDGMLTDRINVAPGELKIRLDVANPNCMMVYRLAQKDMTVAVTEAKVSRESTQALIQGLGAMQKTPTIRTYMFPSLPDLHSFVTAITGFKVLFDGTASAFAIARRRMVVPIHKKWEAGMTRIQVVRNDGITQLLAFFTDFSHGQCMSFVLKGTDVYETFGRGSKFGLKVDDAKFPLPKILGQNDDAVSAADAAFVCLDMPELPGEHDDISIIFDSEAERERFMSCLPAPVKGSRLFGR